MAADALTASFDSVILGNSKQTGRSLRGCNSRNRIMGQSQTTSFFAIRVACSCPNPACPPSINWRENKGPRKAFSHCSPDMSGTGATSATSLNSPTYAPALFCKERDANGMRKEDLAGAMRRLFERQEIHVESYGRPSRPYTRLRQGRKEDEPHGSRANGQAPEQRAGVQPCSQ